MTNNDCDTVLMVAARYGYKDVIDILAGYNCNLDAQQEEDSGSALLLVRVTRMLWMR